MVQFQENAWCDENMMKIWVRQLWKPACQDSMHLVMDVHRPQTTDAVKELLEDDCNTHITYVPGMYHIKCLIFLAFSNYCFVQVAVQAWSNLWMFAKPFKSAIEQLATEHMQNNLEAYVHGQINASARRVLFTKWVGQAWEQMSSDKAMVIRSFQKVGIAVAIDGSEDDKINIEGLHEYEVGTDSDDEDYTTDEEDDPFASCSSDDED